MTDAIEAALEKRAGKIPEAAPLRSAPSCRLVDLAGIDQLLALAPAELDAVPFGAVDREAGDRKRLALRAGFLDPVIAPA